MIQCAEPHRVNHRRVQRDGAVAVRDVAVHKLNLKANFETRKANFDTRKANVDTRKANFDTGNHFIGSRVKTRRLSQL